MNNPFSTNYIAVGAASDDDHDPCVVISFQGGIISMSEAQARKMADDILRNANYLWPIDEDEK
jgi:hypothetical protein